ncbi:MAG: T9SS type A sorting domain-containing protein, partial [Ignavibacteria bacterium]
IFVSVDYSQSGKIYLAEGKRIYVSENYGETFSEYKVLDKRIVGIYKKPGSDMLYASSKYNLYEITPDSIKVVKILQPDPCLAEYYPLAIGNKWVYSVSICPFAQPCHGYLYTVDITGDTTMSNGLKYYIFEKISGQVEVYFDRYNEEDFTIRRFTEDTSFFNNEYIILELTAEVGDTLCSDIFSIPYDCGFTTIFTEEANVSLFNNVFKKRKYEVPFIPGYEYSLVKGLGFYGYLNWGNDPGGGSIIKGCIINGILYGDTSLTGINDRPRNLPAEFSLSQNFPNPFNPATKIRYSIPGRQFVTLKVFDLLGREIIVLVNEEKPAGEYEIEFDDSSLSSGIYFYQLKAGNSILTKKMIYLK